MSVALGYHNARAFGAIGDGTTDDTAALQAMIDSCGSSGRAGYIPKGSYRLTAALSMAVAGVKIFGDGQNETTILAPLTTANAVNVTAAGCEVADLGVDGRYASQVAGNQIGVRVDSGGDRCTLSNLYVRNTALHGIYGYQVDDIVVDSCRVEHLMTAASKVQSVPSPTTTTFGVAIGMASKFSVGQVLKIGSQTGTVSSVTSVQSEVAAVTSATVFKVLFGTAVNFSNGQTIRIGNQTGVISSINTGTDTITLTGALSVAPTIGQWVTRDEITLTSAITAPTAGDLVTVNVTRAAGTADGVAKGVYIQECNRAVVRNGLFRGWSQAIGLWYGCNDCEVSGNRIIDNYGYEDGTRLIPRSATEEYGDTAPFQRANRWVNNLVDGSTSCCFELAQGHTQLLVTGNTCRNWATEAGIGGSNAAVWVSGFSSRSGVAEGVRVVGNSFLSKGVASFGVRINDYANGVLVQANNFRGFSATSGSTSPVWITGGTAPAISGNSFDLSNRAVLVDYSASSQGAAPVGIVAGNLVRNLPAAGTVRVFDLINCGDGWVFDGNTIEGESGSNAIGLFLQSGKGHTVRGNTLRCGSPVYVFNATDVIVQGNYCRSNDAGSYGCVTLQNASGCVVTRNVLDQQTSALSACVAILGSGDNNFVRENRPVGTSKGLYDGGSGRNYYDMVRAGGSTTSDYSAWKTLAATVGTSQSTVAHGLGYTPLQENVIIDVAAGGRCWQTQAPDGTNIYLTAAASSTGVSVRVR